jgi:tetratricopeptide (TPR) repeat protein
MNNFVHDRDRYLIKLVSILLTIVLFSLQWKNILELAVNNFTVRGLIRELPDLRMEIGRPQCERLTNLMPEDHSLSLGERFHFKAAITTLNRARLAWLAGNCDQARTNFRIIFDKSPGDPRAALWLFWLSNSSNSLESLLIQPEVLANIAWDKGLQAEKAGYFDSALDWYELSYWNVPNSDLSYRLLGLYLRLQKTGQAQEFLARIIQKSSVEKSEYWWAVGKITSLKEDWLQAAQAYGKGAEVVDDPFDFLLEQAVAYERLGDRQAEELAYQRAAKARPNDFYPYIGLGQIKRRENNLTGALEFYDQAEQIAPTHYLPKFVIGELYFENNKLVEAQDYLLRSIELEPQNAYAYYYLALIKYRFIQITNSIEYLNRAIEISSGVHPDWDELLGDWRLEVGDNVGALEAYDLALGQSPGDLDLREKIEKLNGGSLVP